MKRVDGWQLTVGSVALALAVGCAQPPTANRQLPTLRICADPDNLPYSNQNEEGFENKIAHLVARDLGARVAYTWWPQRRGFVRNTLKAGDCDMILGVPSNFEMAWATRPYYRSSYVFVSRRDRSLGVTSLDDARLKTWRVGVQMIGNDHTNSPPAHALAKRGAIANVVGFMVYDGGGSIVDAVARGVVDVAIVWGPQAGYFARRSGVPLEIAPVTPQIDLPFLPFVFDISMAVRRGDEALHGQLERVIERRRAEIDAILDQYGVPRV
jgi:mxaJ protein